MKPRELDPNPEFDKAGYCVKCHCAIAEFDGDQKVVKLLGTADTADFELDDGSIMRVAVCTECREKLKPLDTLQIMEAVYKGWAFEIEHYCRWPEDRKQRYLDKYGRRYIVGRTDEHWSLTTIEKAVGGAENMGGVLFQLERSLKDKKEKKPKEAKV